MKNYQILNGSWLKIIAVTTMAIGHTAAFLPYFWEHPMLYAAMRTIGRIAFVTFAFLLVEGFVHTHNRRKYGRNLVILAIISQLPYSLIHNNFLFYTRLNVGFTLFFGFLALYIWEQMKENRVRRTLALVGIFTIAHFWGDGGIAGVGLILLLYVLREQKVLKLFLGTCIIARRYIPGVAAGFALLALYNGKRGFITGSFGKYFFYAFYPLHLLLLYLLRTYWLTT